MSNYSLKAIIVKNFKLILDYFSLKSNKKYNDKYFINNLNSYREVKKEFQLKRLKISYKFFINKAVIRKYIYTPKSVC